MLTLINRSFSDTKRKKYNRSFGARKNCWNTFISACQISRFFVASTFVPFLLSFARDLPEGRFFFLISSRSTSWDIESCDNATRTNENFPYFRYNFSITGKKSSTSTLVIGDLHFLWKVNSTCKWTNQRLTGIWLEKYTGSSSCCEADIQNIKGSIGRVKYLTSPFILLFLVKVNRVMCYHATKSFADHKKPTHLCSYIFKSSGKLCAGIDFKKRSNK